MDQISPTELLRQLCEFDCPNVLGGSGRLCSLCFVEGLLLQEHEEHEEPGLTSEGCLQLIVVNVKILPALPLDGAVVQAHSSSAASKQSSVLLPLKIFSDMCSTLDEV